MGVAVALSPQPVTVEPGQTVTVQVTVRNTGSVVDEYTLKTTRNIAAWASFQPSVVQLFPNTEQQATLIVSPPRNSEVPSGPMRFGVKATSTKDHPPGAPVDEAVGESTLDIGEFADLFPELVPRTVRARRVGKTELAIDNRGNVPLDLELGGPPIDSEVAVDLEPPAVHCEPGTATFVKVRVRPSKRYWRGPPKTFPFQIRASRTGQPETPVDGLMVQEPLVPRWAWQAAVLAILGLIALVILWFTLLKPTVESAAKEAAKEEVAPLLATTGGGGGGGAGGGGATTTTTAAVGGGPVATTAPPASATATAAGDPKAFRLVVETNGDGEKSEPFDGKVFSLTDIVFQNASGDYGTVRVLRGNDVVLEVGLENFRDLDFHYVAPIVFTNQPVVVQVQCTNSGNKPNAPDGQCKPAVSFTGYERPAA